MVLMLHLDILVVKAFKVSKVYLVVKGYLVLQVHVDLQVVRVSKAYKV